MLRLIPSRANKNLISSIILCRNASHSHAPTAHGHFDRKEAYPYLGNREIVGHGITGQPHYFDFPDVPCPSVRWEEDSKDITALKNKEKGDWKNLSIEDKKALYRHSFRQTFAEMEAPDGEWKLLTGYILGFLGLAVILYKVIFQNIIYDYPRPQSSTVEHQATVLQRMIAEGQGRVHGISSNWDYEKGDWKWNSGKK